MIPRDIKTELEQASAEYPVVTVIGPRQSGKTTLVRMVFQDKPYFSLEAPDIRKMAEDDPRGFLGNIPDGGILDEIQRVPKLLSYIQEIIDSKNQSGMFILTGSHQPEMHQAVSQTLAGRTAILTLYPFSISELRAYKTNWDPFELIFTGAFPRVHEEKLNPTRFFNGYIQTYVERDVRALINIKDQRHFQHFLMLLAGRTGQVINYSSLSNDIGVSSTTVKHWISVLKSSYVVFELPPFFENVGKRVIKSPKIYFCDTGLVSNLLGIESGEQIFRDPLRGGLYENLIILEFLKASMNQGKRPDFYFYRDTHGNEVDLIIRRGRKLIPVEIKSAATFTPDFLKGMENLKKVLKESVANGLIVYNGKDNFSFKGTKIINLLTSDAISELTDIHDF